MLTAEIETTEHATYVVDVRRARRGRLAWRTATVLALVLGAGPAWQAWPQREPGSPTAMPLQAGDQVSVALTGTGDVTRLQPAVRHAVTRAVTAADGEGVSLRVTSGWRSSVKQQRLYDDALAKYGSSAKARWWVLPPRKSQHVTGGAVDVGPPTAATWLEPHQGQPCPSLEPHA